MNVFRKVLTVLIIVFAGIVLILMAGVLAWQYFESQSEISHFKAEISKYEKYYLKDHNQLKGKTENELREMIKDVDTEFEKISPYLPLNNYLKLYQHLDLIKTLYQAQKVTITFNNIEVLNRDFYEILNVSAYAIGHQENIAEATKNLKENVKLVDFHSICLESVHTDNEITVNMNFNLYAFIVPSVRVKKNNKLKKDPIDKGYMTWLPPFSYKVKRYSERAAELKKLEISMSDMKNKLELFGEYNRRRSLLEKLEFIIEHLIEDGKDDDIFIQKFPINIKPCKEPLTFSS